MNHDLAAELPDTGLSPDFIVRVVSFPDATERRDQFGAMMKPFADIDWAFHDVVPPEALPVPYDDEVAYRTSGSVLSSAERSCAASHLTMFQEFLKGSADYLIAVEDDVLFDPHIRFYAHVKFMALCNVDFYKLFARFSVPSRFLGNVGRIVFYRASWPTLGGQCYIVSRAGARALLKHAGANGGLTSPIDDTNDSFWATGLPIVFSYPYPLMESGRPTSIHAGRPAIRERNAQLAETSRAPSRFIAIRRSVDRRIADFALRKFDRDLAQRIVRNRTHLHRAFHR